MKKEQLLKHVAYPVLLNFDIIHYSPCASIGHLLAGKTVIQILNMLLGVSFLMK